MPREQTLRRIALLLGLLGLGVATYIAIVESSGGSPVCVAGSTGCSTVAESDYAELLGINVAFIGVVGYLSILAATLIGSDLGRAAGFLFATIGFGFSLYLTYLELFVIDAICQWCVASAVLMTGLFVVSVLRAFGYVGQPPAGLPFAASPAGEGQPKAEDRP